MEAAVYCILFLCGILSQGICNLSEDNNEKSSAILIRRRRISGGVRKPIEHVPHIVVILVNGNYHCPATLLTTDVAITSAQCVKNANQQRMSIQSSSSVGNFHHQIINITLLDPNYSTTCPTLNNLALVKFTPPINLSVSLNRPAFLYNGSLAIQDLVIQVFNWGSPQHVGARKLPSRYIQSIFMQLISIDHCQSVYPGIIGRGTLCAYGVNARERCHDEDTGAPLFAEGQLLGIMAFHGHAHHVNPEVFMNLMDPEIRRWIQEYIPALRLV